MESNEDQKLQESPLKKFQDEIKEKEIEITGILYDKDITITHINGIEIKEDDKKD